MVQVELRDRHVDCLALEGVEALARSERHELDLGRVVEDRRRERTAEVDVEAGPVALFVLDRETGDSLTDAAEELAAVLHRLQRLGVGRPHGRNRERRRGGEYRFYDAHDQPRILHWAAIRA